MGKQRRRTKSTPQQFSFSSNTTEKSNYEHGPYYCGRGGSTFLSEELSRREFTPGLCFGELLTLELMNCIAWARRSLVIHEIAAPYLALQLYPVPDPASLPRDKKGRRIVPGERSIKRWLKSLRDQGYLRLHREDRENGNSYFVEPVFIWDSKWHELAGIETATCIRTSGDHPNIWLERWMKSTSGQGGPTLGSGATVARPSGQGGPTECAASRLMSGHSGPDPRSRSSDHTAQRVTAPTTPSGGAELPPSEAEKRSPDGQDRTAGMKGVGQSADDTTKPTVFNVAQLNPQEALEYNAKVREVAKRWLNKSITEAEYRAEITELNKQYGQRTFFVEPTRAPKKKRPVGSGARSNFHART